MTAAMVELMTIGSTMVCTCELSFTYHFDRACQLGGSAEDLRKAVHTGLSVGSATHRKVVETAERYLSHGAPADEGIPCCSGTASR